MVIAVSVRVHERGGKGHASGDFVAGAPNPGRICSGSPTRGERVIDVHDDLAAALADRYELERELGHGGMAIVYLARDVKHGRRVAVKVLRPDLASSVGAERFLREIDVAAKLTHPSILTLHDSGSAPGGLLYYVMPFVDGETLRARLEREHQLPIDEALAITRQVGDALDYAHAHGVVHRDVKPENILLMDGHVLVADFGLARALYAASSRRLTESAVAVGTPAYMSPEQAAADPDVDGRADVYSLACVLYEMVAGTPPFRGATAQAVLAQHLTATPPSICAQRPHCPKAVDAAVQRAMEKVPADRFRTAREFVEALEAREDATAPAATVRRSRRRIAIATAVAAATLVVAVAAGRHIWIGAQEPLDPRTFVVLPFTAPTGHVDAALGDRIAEALGRWEGLRVVDAQRSGEVISKFRSAPLSTNTARSIARELRAGRVVWGDVSSDGGSLVVRATLYDPNTDSVLRSVQRVLGPSRRPGDLSVRALANALLRARDELPWKTPEDASRPSLDAWITYDHGRQALAQWDLATATREFDAALAVDPDFPQAALWSALVRMWSGEQGQRWRGAARHAFELRQRLSSRDSLLAAAQFAMAESNYPSACEAYRRVLPLDTTGVIAWYGIGECLSRDGTVVPDTRSKSGFRFRTSIAAAVAAYLHILDERAPPQPAFVYARLSSVLPTAPNQLRRGHGGDRDAPFGAYATLDHDTLAYTPFPLGRFMTGGADLAPGGIAAAVERSRAMLRRAYVQWAQTAPSSVDAHVALAGLLEMMEEIGSKGGDALSAIGESQRARALAGDAAQRTALATRHLRLLVKSAEWRSAAMLADSIFAWTGPAVTDTTLSGVAELSGRVAVAASILRANASALSVLPPSPNGEPLDVPSAIAQDAAAMQAYAAAGACTNLLRGFPKRLDHRLDSYLNDVSRRSVVREALLRRPLSLAAPCLGVAPLAGVAPGGDPALAIQSALAAHDTARVHATWVAIRAARRQAGLRPGDVAIDYTYLESWTLAAAGDTAAAILHLDQTLEALPTLGTYVLNNPAQSAGLVRAMGLRAELAAALGDEATARRWANAVATLWATADPELQPYVARMRRLASPG